MVDPVHRPPITLIESAVSNFLMREVSLVQFTHILQHASSQRSAFHHRTQADDVYLLSTILSEPEVSNFLVREPWVTLFTYSLQHSESRRSAISSVREPYWTLF